MADRTFSSDEFSNDVSATVQATAGGPVFITEQGRPAFVLLKIDDYYRMTGRTEATLLEAIGAMPDGDNFDFEPPRLDIQIKPFQFD